MHTHHHGTISHTEFTGLSAAEVTASRKKHGSNTLQKKEPSGFWRVGKDLVTEPMFLLLVVAAGIYFVLGENTDGWIMLAAIGFVSAISLYQETRSHHALQSLKKLTQPNSKVIRDGAVAEIPTRDIVVDDLIIVEEGNLVPADAVIVQSNDFSINESILTGESFAVSKQVDSQDHSVYYGTLVTSGSAVARVIAVGILTELGKIGRSLEKVTESKTPLQVQINTFVKKMAGFGLLAFLIVWTINYEKSGDWLDGLLHGLTLAMSVLPEEIPVAFATFMALGAWKLIRNGVLAKEPQTVETLGSATVICIDKTGTITENKMKLVRIYHYAEDRVLDTAEDLPVSSHRILAYAMWASEVDPFDPMEAAIHQAYQELHPNDRRSLYRMVHEYPLSGTPPMMTHIYARTDAGQSSERIIAAKGGWETIVRCARLPETEVEKITRHAESLARNGYRVLGVASAEQAGPDFPANQEDFHWQFQGLIALEDPPKPNISSVFQRFYHAGIQLKMITGDYLETAISIARQTQFAGSDQALSGREIMEMNDEELTEAVERTNLFTRMYPEAKLRVIEALKRNGEVVAMTGDGVNDAPALKSAHIGVAMGERGTETAKQAASMVIIDDNLDKIADAIFLGRRIYTNFKKAVRYIISIHIPIILTVSVPLILGWEFANIFSPIHVIFFELIMGPTCSIIFENEPMEERLKTEKPRKMTSRFFSLNELTLSITQGLAITTGVLFLYKTTMDAGFDLTTVRTVAFTTILLSNIFLTLVNRSFFYSVFTTLTYPNRLLPLIIFVSLLMLFLALNVPAVQSIFELDSLHSDLFFRCLFISFLSMAWIEGYKWDRRRQAEAGR